MDLTFNYYVAVQWHTTAIGQNQAASQQPDKGLLGAVLNTANVTSLLVVFHNT